jgi:hypothetical protein
MRPAYRVLLVGVLFVGLAAVASSAGTAASAGINATSVTTTLDGDGDERPSRGELVVHLDTTCAGCYDGGRLFSDPEMEPKVKLEIGDDTETIGGLPNRHNHTIRRTIDAEDHLDSDGTITITVTLFDDDTIGQDRVDRRRLTVEMEPLAADETPAANRSFSYTVENVTRCGTFCGEATAVFENVDDESHDDITVTVDMVAGSKDIWHDERTIGTLAPNETVTVSQRVNLGPMEIIDVRRNDMQLTARIITVRDGGSEVLIEELDLR